MSLTFTSDFNLVVGDHNDPGHGVVFGIFPTQLHIAFLFLKKKGVNESSAI